MSLVRDKTIPVLTKDVHVSVDQCSGGPPFLRITASECGELGSRTAAVRLEEIDNLIHGLTEAKKVMTDWTKLEENKTDD